MPEITIQELAQRLGGRAIGAVDRTVRGVAPLETAGPDDLSLVANRKYLAYVGETRAAAVLVSEELAEQVPAELSQIRVAHAHLALGEALAVLYPPPPIERGIHPTALLEDGVELGPEVAIGPYAVLGRSTVIGRGARIGAHCVIGDGCRLGENVVLHPHVTLYPGVVLGDRCIVHSGARLGKEGFGYVFTEGAHRKVPQVGGCRIEADVEIGANTTIDRGSIGDTVVGRGTKIDNLVHLGHNVRIGEHAILIAQVGVAGSSAVGDGAVLAGQAGISGHVTIGAGARVAAQAGVIGDIAAGETVSGYPARPHRDAMRAQAALFRFPSLFRRIQEIEQAVRRLTGGSAGAETSSERSTSE